MIHLDTNFLILSLVAGSRQDQQLRKWLSSGEPLGLDSIVWAEFLCGPVNAQQVQLSRAVFPHPEPFLPDDSARAAELFNRTGRRRGSLADCMIAAVCLRLGAALATENLDDFRSFQALGLNIVNPDPDAPASDI